MWHCRGLQVLEAVLYGDAEFFREHRQLMDALVRVYFHSSSNKYNRMECWGPLKDAALVNGYTFKLVQNEWMLVVIFDWKCCFAGERSRYDKWLLIRKQGNVACSQVLGEPKIDLSSSSHLPSMRRRRGYGVKTEAMRFCNILSSYQQGLFSKVIWFFCM